MAPLAGILAIGAFVPRLRLPRATIAEAIGWANPQARAQTQGTRAVCNWDEDALTLAVEAARGCPTSSIDTLMLASTTLPFADRDNGAVAAVALNLPEPVQTLTFGSSLRAGTSALIAAAERKQGTSLVIASDARLAQPGSAQELAYGHGAAAFVVSSHIEDALAEIVGFAHLTADFVDHYRMAGEAFDYALEERWVRDEGFLKLIPRAVDAALSQAHLERAQVSRLIMVGGAAAKRVAERCNLANAKLADPLHKDCGDTGAAHPLLLLAATLEEMQPGETALVIGFGQGVDVIAVRACKRAPGRVAAALERGSEERSYVRYLAHAGLLAVDFGMRAERDNRTAHTVAYRKSHDVTGFIGGKCSACVTVQFPKSRVCVNPQCRATDTQQSYRLAESEGRVKSFTEDWQAYSPRPPYIYGNVEFAEGGNLLMELTDLEPGELEVDARVRFVFRVKDIDAMRKFKRYFWKAVKV